MKVEVFLGVFIGAVTFTGSIIAFGKLAGRVAGKLAAWVAGRLGRQAQAGKQAGRWQSVS